MTNHGLKRIRMSALVLGMGLVLAVGVSAETPTFTKDIAPIFQAKCESCHRPTSIAPMSLMTYQEVRPWLAAIEAAVESREIAAVAHRQDGPVSNTFRMIDRSPKSSSRRFSTGSRRVRLAGTRKTCRRR